jgi:hypothetical protein
VKSAPMKPAEAAAVKSTTTAMEATTTASAMPSIGHLRLEYRADTEQSSREATQSFSAPGPACIAANRFHRSLLLKRRGSHVWRAERGLHLGRRYMWLRAHCAQSILGKIW